MTSSTPYKGRRITCDLDDGLRLVLCVRGVTGCTVAEVPADRAENSVELFDGTGARIAGGRVGAWARVLVPRPR